MKTTIKLTNLIKEQGEAIKALKQSIRSKSMASSSEWRALRLAQENFRIDHILNTFIIHKKLIDEDSSDLISDDLFDIRLNGRFLKETIIELGIESENSKSLPGIKKFEERLNNLIKENFLLRKDK